MNEAAALLVRKLDAAAKDKQPVDIHKLLGDMTMGWSGPPRLGTSSSVVLQSAVLTRAPAKLGGQHARQAVVQLSSGAVANASMHVARRSLPSWQYTSCNTLGVVPSFQCKLCTLRHPYRVHCLRAVKRLSLIHAADSSSMCVIRVDFHRQACQEAAVVGPPTDADRLRDAASVLFGNGAHGHVLRLTCAVLCSLARLQLNQACSLSLSV